MNFRIDIKNADIDKETFGKLIFQINRHMEEEITLLRDIMTYLNDVNQVFIYNDH